MKERFKLKHRTLAVTNQAVKYFTTCFLVHLPPFAPFQSSMLILKCSDANGTVKVAWKFHWHANGWHRVLQLLDKRAGG